MRVINTWIVRAADDMGYETYFRRTFPDLSYSLDRTQKIKLETDYPENTLITFARATDEFYDTHDPEMLGYWVLRDGKWWVVIPSEDRATELTDPTLHSVDFSVGTRILMGHP